MTINNKPDTTDQKTGLQIILELAPVIEASGGLTLSQVCSIASIEPFTVQNWVKRGFVAHPVKKKYGKKHLARILLITCLKDSMPLDNVGMILKAVNGSADDESDDIIPDEKLYAIFCRSSILCSESGKPVGDCIEEVLDGETGISQVTREKLKLALLSMLYAYESGKFKKQAEEYMSRLTEA